MMEFAGTLRERIVVERPISVRNDMGLQEPGWEEVCRCLASVALESVGAESEGQALSAMPRFRVTMRRRDARIDVGRKIGHVDDSTADLVARYHTVQQRVRESFAH